MSRRGKRVTAAMLALLMVVSSSFSQVTTVQATEITVEAAQEAGADATVTTEVVAEEKETETKSVEVTTESSSVETSQEVQTSTEGTSEVTTESSVVEDSQEVQTSTERTSEETTESSTVEASQEEQTTTEVTNEVAVLAETGESQTDTTVKTAREAVYFSEYIEGSSNNKALEIYNGTGADIDLSSYKIVLYDNGKTVGTKGLNTYAFDAGTILKAGDVYVLVHSQAGEALKAYGDKTSSVCNFNGDDAVALYHGDSIIDVLGTIGEKVKWKSEDKTKSFENNTLVRNANVTTGTADFDFDEWTVYSNDTFTNLGAHVANGVVITPPQDDQIQLELSSIADVKEKKEGNFKVTGIVTFIDGKNVYLQDETAGIDAYFNNENCNIAECNIAIGDTLTVTGTYKEFNGLVELDKAEKVELVKATEETVLPVKEVTLAELKADYEATGLLESTRVYIKNVTLGEVNTNGNTIITDADGNSYPIYKVPALADVEEGDIVNVYAVVSEYKNLQLRVASAAEVEAVNPIEKVTIAEARAAADQTADITVRGTVTFIDGRNVTIQDETAGINLYYGSAQTDIKIGDRLTVKGTRAAYNGLVQLSGVETLKLVTPTNSLDKLPVKTVTIEELVADFAGNKTYMSTRVLVENVTLTELDTSKNSTVKDAKGNSVVIYKMPESTAKQGDKISFYAVVSVFNSLQLRVASGDDILPVEVAPDAPVEETFPSEGDYVIWAPAYNKALSANYGSSYYNPGVDVTFANSELSGYGSTEIWTITVASEISENDKTYKTYYVSHNGQKLSMDTSYSSMPLDKVHDTWVFEEAADGCFYMKNVGRACYAEWYASNNYWSGYGKISSGSEGMFALKFTKAAKQYAVDDSYTATVASWGGGMIPSGNESPITDMSVKGDIYDINDKLDTTSEFTVVLDGKNAVTYTDATISKNNHYMGSSNFGTNDYLQFTTSAYGYGNMDLSFRMRVSNAAPAEYQLQYSTDGANFKNFTTGSYNAKYTIYTSDSSSEAEYKGNITNGIAKMTSSVASAGAYVTFNFDIPSSVAHADKLVIRIVGGSTRANGNTEEPNGNVRIDTVAIKGNPIVSENIVGYVSTNTPSGTAVGQVLELSTATEGATIYYSLNGGEYKQYAANNKPVFTELPVNVATYATKDGLASSVKTYFTFTQQQCEMIKARPNGGAVALGTGVVLKSATEGATIQYAFVTEGVEEVTWMTYENPIILNTLPATIQVKAVKEGYLDSAVSTLSFTQRENEKYNIYFGQLHAHTSYSDGAGTCEEAFEHASSTENIDFLAVTDHSNSFDNADNANINDGSMSTEWVEGHELADKYTTEDFVGLYGYEMTWSNGLGHMNTFNSAGFQSRTQADYKTYATALQNYYAALQTAPDSISQFNHPGTTFGDFSDFAYYSEANDSLITLVEVGNGEGAIGSSGYFPSYEYYTRALDKGWHVAPTNNQDNHKGLWGNANTARSVVLADSLTRENIYDAMRNYRVYATEDNDLNIYYTLDSYIMGTSLEKDLVGEKVEIKVELSDETDAKLGKVEVIVNGGLSIANTTVSSNEETVVFEVPSSYSYYYIKVTQADGDIAVTAPVWVGKVEAAGINGISTDAALPITNEALDVTLGLYNNESEEMTINEITFSVDGTVVETVDLATAGLNSVAPEATATYTFSYTHNKVGSMEMDVTVKATLNGAEKVYNDVLKLTYVDNSMVSHVIIDGTHYNDYVAGYYGGNMGNFIGIAADKNIKATIVTDKITDETLANASVLIVSAPAKKSGTANAGDYVVSHYEDEFIQTVKNYVENGGTVIVCGIADYQDSTAGQTATETNKLLEAIGATIRMNSDEAYDEVNNGGQPYRLYYENVNLESEHLNGFVEGQTYSAYSGCTVNIDGATEETSTVYPAVALVRGFDTTYSVDCKTPEGNSAGNTVVVEQGKVVALASQKTKFGGEIFVAGSVFMSDFEVKVEADNYGTLPYANLTIINNILDSKKVEIPATDIAEVRKAEIGDVFAIEGYVANGTENEATTFFDAIYVQDKTGGITVFPFAQAGVKPGTKIRVVGYVDEYQGDKEIQIVSYEILDDVNLVEIKPTQMSVKDSMDYDQFGGSYIQVTGTVSRVDVGSDGKTVSEFWLTDGNGNEAAIFIDGYISSGTTGEKVTTDMIKEGEVVTAAGFLYKHPEGAEDTSVPVLRVADCDDIKVETVKPVNPEPSKPEASNPENKEENTSNNTSSSNTNTSTAVKKEEPKKDTVVIEDVKTPLANVVGVVTVDVKMSSEKKVLQLELLAKYYENETYRQNTVIQVYTSSNVGMTVVAGNVASKVTKEMNLTLEKKVLPSTPQHQVVFFEAEAASQYDFDFMMHMHVGKENAGKKAQIFVRTSKDATPVLVQEMTVNDIGNVAYQTQSVSDVIVLIAE